jgi:hypothetical protein
MPIKKALNLNDYLEWSSIFQGNLLRLHSIFPEGKEE